MRDGDGLHVGDRLGGDVRGGALEHAGEAAEDARFEKLLNQFVIFNAAGSRVAKLLFRSKLRIFFQRPAPILCAAETRVSQGYLPAVIAKLKNLKQVAGNRRILLGRSL